jgi:hypothetical protein
MAVAGAPPFDVSHHDTARYRFVEHGAQPFVKVASLDTTGVMDGYSKRTVENFQ